MRFHVWFQSIRPYLGRALLIVTCRSEVACAAQDRQGIQGESWSIEVQDLMTLEEVVRYFGRDDRRCPYSDCPGSA